jgi:hypothetical protein
MATRNKVGAVFFLLLAAAPTLHARAAVLLGEPYGGLGRFSPTGHAAVYLERVCAASPTVLRRCEPGELGVVLSRYRVAGYDWIAIPLIPYLYAVDRAEDVPESADAQTVARLRDLYRRRYLLDLVPDDPQGESPKGPWVQLIGAAYDRKIFAFEIETQEEQDDAFIREFNARTNKTRFHPLARNCADFAREVINLYYPKAVRRSIIADAGITTPKQVAKSLVRYAKKHRELHFSGFVIEQVPGSLPRSKSVRGVLESLVKSKKYAVPMLVAHLWLTPGLAVGYLTTGRFNPGKHAAALYGPAEIEQRALARSMRASATPQPDRALTRTDP